MEKYSVVIRDDAGDEFPTHLERYGELWSDPLESIKYINLIIALAYEIDELRKAALSDVVVCKEKCL